MLSLANNTHHGAGHSMPVESLTEARTACGDRLGLSNSRVTPSRRADTAGGEVSLLRPVASTPFQPIASSQADRPLSSAGANAASIFLHTRKG